MSKTKRKEAKGSFPRPMCGLGEESPPRASPEEKDHDENAQAGRGLGHCKVAIVGLMRPNTRKGKCQYWLGM